MNNSNTHWSAPELKVYLLIYCANADFQESNIETDFIRNHADGASYDKMHIEFNNDSDFQRIEKIRQAIKRLDLSKSQLEALFVEINEMMNTIGTNDILNENTIRELHHILG